MQFFGPVWRDTPMWFELYAPGTYFYPIALQVCFTLADLKPQVPIQGTIMAAKGRKRLMIDLEVEEFDSFQLSWPAEFCDTVRDKFVEPISGTGDPPRGVAAIRASGSGTAC